MSHQDHLEATKGMAAVKLTLIFSLSLIHFSHYQNRPLDNLPAESHQSCYEIYFNLADEVC